MPRRPPQSAIESSIRGEIEDVLQEYAGIGGLEDLSQQVRVCRVHIHTCVCITTYTPTEEC